MTADTSTKTRTETKWIPLVVIFVIFMLGWVFFLWSSSPNPLVHAVEAKSVWRVRLLCFVTQDINAQEWWYGPMCLMKGNTPLESAAVVGDENIARILLKHGADPNRGRALHIATGNNFPRVVKVLLDHGANIDALASTQTADERAALYIAVDRQRPEVLRLLIERGASLDQSKALYRAAQTGDELTARYLLDHGADPNTRVHEDRTNEDLNTPLHGAASAGQTALVKLLLERSANPNLKNYRDKTPLDLALERKHEEMVDILVRAGTEISFFTAIRMGDVERCSKMIREDPSLILKNPYPSSSPHHPLIEAIEEQKPQIVELLLAQGMNPDGWSCDSGDRMRPLQLAAALGNEEIINLLLAKGAGVDLRGSYGDADDTALTHACIFGHARIAEILLEHGADIDGLTAPKYNCSPLDYAIWGKHTNLVEVLLQNGAYCSPGEVIRWQHDLPILKQYRPPAQSP